MKNTNFLVKLGICFVVALSTPACVEDDHIREIHFEDPNLRACIMVYAENIGWWHARMYREVVCRDRDITSLVGMEHFVNLESLRLAGNDIIDITPVTELPSLQVFALDKNTDFVDVSSLYEIESLISVGVVGCNDIACDDLQALIDYPRIDVAPETVNPGVNCREG